MLIKNSNFLSVLFLSAILVSAISCKKDDDGSEPTADIIAGEGIAEVKLGDAAQVAVDEFGNGSDSWGSFNGDYYHILSYFSKGLSFSLEPNDSETIDLTKKITVIEITSPYAGTTDKNIGIGSTMAEVKAAYGEPDSESTSFGSTVHTYNIGLEFEYDDQGNDTVVAIIIE